MKELKEKYNELISLSKYVKKSTMLNGVTNENSIRGALVSPTRTQITDGAFFIQVDEDLSNVGLIKASGKQFDISKLIESHIENPEEIKLNMEQVNEYCTDICKQITLTSTRYSKTFDSELLKRVMKCFHIKLSSFYLCKDCVIIVEPKLVFKEDGSIEYKIYKAGVIMGLKNS